MSIKFMKEPQPKGVRIPSAALKICGLQEEKKLEIHALEKAAVILPHTMSALELLRTVEHLNELGEECSEALCPFAPEMDNFKVSPELLDAAGIPGDVRLWACPDEDNKTIHIVEAPEIDLRDIKPDLLAKLTDEGICLGELQKRLTSKVAVYGG